MRRPATAGAACRSPGWQAPAWRSVARAWLALAIAAFALRALVPTGYMLMPVDGRVQWVLCPDATPSPAAASAGMGDMAAAGQPHHHVGDHAGHHPGHDAGDQHGAMPDQGRTSHCPFALASGAALASVQADFLPAWSQLRLPATVDAPAGATADAPLRHAAARGPPTPA